MLSFQSSTINPLPRMEEAFNNAIKNVDASFEYPNPSGNEKLIEQVKNLHTHWDGEVLITNSATEATYLALSQISGGKLALNVPSYFGIIRQAKELNITVVEWETIEELSNIKDVDAILLTSNFTPPTGKSFSNEDKNNISEIADKQDALVIEDNAYEFLSYGNKTLTSIPANKVIRINSFSKLLSPSLRMGFIMAKGELFSKIRSQKITMNLSSSGLSQSIISNILDNEELINSWQKELEERASIAKKEIKEKLNQRINIYDGGSFIQLSLSGNRDLKSVISLAKEKGLLIDDNKNQYMNNQSKSYLRLHLGAISKADIPKAIHILKNVIK